MIKIAILITHWKNTQGTGVTRYFINLVEELKKDCGIQIFILYRYGNDFDNYLINGTKYTFPLKAITVLDRLQPDIIYVDANWYFLLTGVIFKKIRGTKLIATFHSHPSRLPFLGKILMRYLLNSCDVITYVSNNLRRTILHEWAIPMKAKEEVTYAGVQSQSVTDAEVEEFMFKYNISDKSFILLMQSSPIAEVKSNGTKILMRSVLELLPIYPEMILIISGDGPYLDELEEYSASIGIQNQVIFTGWIDNPFIPLTICDIYTHISLGEGLPLALLEAMSIGKPIIATPVGGIPEVIVHGENGLLVEPETYAVEQAIQMLLNDQKLRATLGKNAYECSKKYTWQRCANKFMEIFDGVVL